MPAPYVTTSLITRDQIQDRIVEMAGDIERDTPGDERVSIEKHLAGCAGCRQFLETFRETLRMCRQAARPGADSDCLKRAAEAARAELARRGLL